MYLRVSLCWTLREFIPTHKAPCLRISESKVKPDADCRHRSLTGDCTSRHLTCSSARGNADFGAITSCGGIPFSKRSFHVPSVLAYVSTGRAPSVEWYFARFLDVRTKGAFHEQIAVEGLISPVFTVHPHQGHYALRSQA